MVLALVDIVLTVNPLIAAGTNARIRPYAVHADATATTRPGGTLVDVGGTVYTTVPIVAVASVVFQTVHTRPMSIAFALLPNRQHAVVSINIAVVAFPSSFAVT